MGTRHTPLLERRRLIEAWRTSGLSARAFAEQRGIAPETFRRWLGEADGSASTVRPTTAGSAPSAERAPRFLEVVPSGPSPEVAREEPLFAVEVGGHRLRFAEPPPPAWFASVLGELRRC
jgi:transposase